MIDEQTLEIIEPRLDGVQYPERDTDFGTVYSRPDGTYVIEHNGYPYHVIESDPLFAEVTAYVLEHPEALIPEPVRPPPTEAELAARRVAEARAYLASTDWVIAKLGEAQMLGGDIAGLVAKYQDVLDARIASRSIINSTEASE